MQKVTPTDTFLGKAMQRKDDCTFETIANVTTQVQHYSLTIQGQTPCNNTQESFAFAFFCLIAHSCSFPLPGWHVIMSELFEGEKNKLFVRGQLALTYSRDLSLKNSLIWQLC